MTLDFFSLPQVLGYVTFLLSIVTFTQKRDLHFKVWLTGQNLLYASHFFLMDNPAAMVSALMFPRTLSGHLPEEPQDLGASEHRVSAADLP